MKLETLNLDKIIEFLQTNKGFQDISELVTSLAVLADNYLTSNDYTVDDLPLVVKQKVNLEILAKVANIDYTEKAQDIIEDVSSLIKTELSGADNQKQQKILDKLEILQHDLYEILR